ncbi:MAG: 4'-phosphopantetheinyl transferase superfamily protein [Deltaproteobacteria bacterium]|nr:4'-phosphopantetheinyl transferase superfamily protein [Deltaproteobacteria bacterium]
MIGWLVRSLDDVPPGDGWLSPGERATLAGPRAPKRRADFRLGRFAARVALNALSSRLGVRGEWSVRARDDGSPEALLDGAPGPFALSISHSAGRAMAAVVTRDVALGCDVERIEPRDEALVVDFFDKDERARLPRDGTRDRYVTLVWSAKESALKVLRVGLRADPRALRVTWSDAPRPDGFRPLTVQVDGRTLHGVWRVEDEWVQTIAADPWDDELIALDVG